MKPNPNWLPLTPFFGAPGPFTVKLNQFSSTLIGYFFNTFVIKGGQMLAGFPCIQCYGQQQFHILSDQTASDIYATHTETEGTVTLDQMLSLVRYIHPVAN